MSLPENKPYFVQIHSFYKVCYVYLRLSFTYRDLRSSIFMYYIKQALNLHF